LALAVRLVSPADFIPLAEETGLIIPLGEWVLREACGRMKACAIQASDLGVVAVNLSPRCNSTAPTSASASRLFSKRPGCRRNALRFENHRKRASGTGRETPRHNWLLSRRLACVSPSTISRRGIRRCLFETFSHRQIEARPQFHYRSFRRSTSMEIAAAIVRLAHSLKIEALAERRRDRSAGGIPCGLRLPAGAGLSVRQALMGDRSA